MGREVKRVDLNFKWPKETWWGYCLESVPCGYCKKNGLSDDCELCYGDGWAPVSIDPPEGEGWQLWETVSEGSPITPVCASADELAQWLFDNGDPVHGKLTKETWMNMINRGHCPSLMIENGRVYSGPEACDP